MTASVEQIRQSRAAIDPRATGSEVSAAREGGRRIVVILPRGEAIRNFVYSGAIDEAARSADVRPLSVMPDGETWELLGERYGTVHELKATKERLVVGYVRELLDMAHGRWLWSEAARERWRLRDAEAEAHGQRAKRMAKKLACYPFSNRTGLKLLSSVEDVTSRLFRTTDEYVTLFRELRPTLVFNGSHVHSQVAQPAVNAARWLGIPTAAFIFSWDNLTSQGRIIPQYDYYLVWNEAIRQQLLDIYGGVTPEQVFVTGTPQFDFHFRPEYRLTRAEFCRRVGADPSRPVVLYTTGMANHMPDEPAIVEGIASMLAEMSDLGAPQLLVRVYAKDRTGRFEDLKRRRPDILFPDVPWVEAWLTPKPEDSYLLTNSLRHAAVGVNIASTVSLELCMFDKPVVNVAYRPEGGGLQDGIVDYRRYYEFDHYRPVVESGAVELATSEAQMRVLLRQALESPQAASPKRRWLIRQMFGSTLDGYSAIRVADRLVRLASVAVPESA